MVLARKWADIPGVKINDCFFNLPNVNRYSADDICEALVALGKNPMIGFKGKKCWQFYKNNTEEKIIQAIKSL